MTAIPTPPRVEPPAAQTRLGSGELVGLLWNCAWSSLWLAFMLQLCGSVALSLAVGICKDMVPSLPPGWNLPTATPPWHWHLAENNAFALIYGLVFLGKLAAGLVRHSQHPRHRKAAAWLLRAMRNVGDNWFGLTAGNALSALIAVLVWQCLQGFSLSGLLGQFLLDLFRPVLEALFRVTGTGDAGQAVTDLAAWYHANQFKFMFWLFYSAGICDDLGLPNYKAVTRWFWLRLRKRMGFTGQTSTHH